MSYVEAVQSCMKNRKMSKEISVSKRAGIVQNSMESHKTEMRDLYSPVKGSTNRVTWKDQKELSGSQVPGKISEGKN